jgi:hypothetical protein
MGSTQDHTATCGRLSWVLIPGPFCRWWWKCLRDLGSVHAGGKPGQRDALVKKGYYEQRKNFSAALALA